MTRQATPKIGLRATSGKRVLRFGLVNVGISMAPAVDSSTRVSAKLLAPDTLVPVKQAYLNGAGEQVKPVKGYPVGDTFVTLEPDEVPGADATDTIEMTANVEAASIPAEWVDKTYLAWPTDETHSDGYALVSDYLRSYGRAFIGTTVVNGTTKAFAIRYSEVYGALVAQVLAFHAQVRWDNVETVRAAVEAIPSPAPEVASLAEQLFSGIPTEFAWESVRDEYGERLSSAIAEKAATGSVAKHGVEVQKPVAADDLLAQLKASIGEKP